MFLDTGLLNSNALQSQPVSYDSERAWLSEAPVTLCTDCGFLVSTIQQVSESPSLIIAFVLVILGLLLLLALRLIKPAKAEGDIQKTLEALPEAVALFNPKGKLLALNSKTTTQLHNRTKLVQELATRCNHSSCQLALIIVDLRSFRQINDTYGRAAGDELLKQPE